MSDGLNGRANCILGVCCFTMADRVSALADEMIEKLKCDPAHARREAKWFLDTFDLVPKGSTGALVKEIAKLAREGYLKADA